MATYQPNNETYVRPTPGKAHVILLGGQSNASGWALRDILAANIPAEQMARYDNGFENVLIAYNCDKNVSEEFVPVKMGQGLKDECGTVRFGPEIGIAEHLTRTYPNEVFYIIKSSTSSSGLADVNGVFPNWLDGGTVLDEFKSTVRSALERMEASGLEPEIFAMAWMQGETDSLVLDTAKAYAGREAELLGHLYESFGSYMAPGGMAFLDAGIYEVPHFTYSAYLNRSKREFVQASINHYFLDTNGHGLDTIHEATQLADPSVIDMNHYDTDDMLKLGNLFGEAISLVLTNAEQSANRFPN